MLNRPQSYWIVLAILAAVLTFEFPFALVQGISTPDNLTHIDAGSSLLLIILTLLSVMLSGITIISHSNLAKQKSYCWIGILVGVILCLVYLREWKSIGDSTLTSTSILPLIIPISLWLAWIGIDRDQKLIRKLGRNRRS